MSEKTFSQELEALRRRVEALEKRESTEAAASPVSDQERFWLLATLRERIEGSGGVAFGVDRRIDPSLLLGATAEQHRLTRERTRLRSLR
jgi:hypothetical protein